MSTVVGDANQRSTGSLPAPNSNVNLSEAESLNTTYRWLILVGLILAAAMELLDTTIVNVALPQMAGNLGTTTQEIAWVSTGYILSNVVVLPMTAFLNTLFGRRNYMAGSIALFTVASFFCGTAHGLGEIIFWRVLQGAGGAALISTAQAALVQVFPKSEQSIVQPLFLMGLAIFPTLGPALGGLITDASSWNWCFWMNVPIGAIATAIVFLCMHDTEPANPRIPVDWTGIGLLAAGLASLQYVLEEGETDDWFSSPAIVRLTIVAVVSLTAMVIWELSPRNTHPVVDLRVLKNRSLAAGITLFVAVGFGLYGVNYLYPVMVQQLHGYSPLQSGLSLLPGGIATAFSIVFCGVISNSPKLSLDARFLTLFGIGMSIIGVYGLSRLNTGSGYSDTFWPLIIRGVSIGFLFVPANTLSIGSLDARDVTQGTGLLGLARQLGGSIGIAIIATEFANYQQINRAYLVENISQSNIYYSERLSALAGSLHAAGYSSSSAQSAALSMINQQLMAQVSALSYNQAFELVMLISVAMIPIVLLMSKPKKGAAAVAMH